MTVRSVRVLTTCLILVLVSISNAAGQSGTGAVAGQVLDEASGTPLPGADVTVEGAVVSTSTDRDGNFRLAPVPAGRVTVIVRYLGREDAKVTVDVTAGGTAKATTPMAVKRYEESLTVSSPLIEDAQARALNQQKTAMNITNVVSADQIGSFPDPNAAEAMQRIPGISIQRDQGEGRYVIIRGTEPRLNATLIEGERIPAPEANVRQVALDVIPADLLQSIEVSKALTPDMDADAIGGSVNLVMKQAPEKLRAFGAIGGGFNPSLSSYQQHDLNFSIGRRFNDKKIGAIFSVTSAGTERGNEDFEPVYTSGNLMDLDLRHYVVTRRRNGATGALDFRPTAGAQYTIRGVYNYYIDDREERQRLRERVVNRRMERELRDRTHSEHIWSTSFTGQHQIGRATLDLRFSGAHADQKDPLTIATTFRQSNVNFVPNVSPTSIDPDNVQANPQNENLSAYTFNQQVRATNFAGERDIVGGADLRFNVSGSPKLTSFLKTGFKYRDKAKTRTRDEVTLTSPTTIPLSVALTSDATHDLLDGRYAFGPFMNMDVAADLPNRYAMNSAVNHARDTEDFEVGERVASAYGMAELYVGPKLLVLPGIRYEHTASDFTGNDVTFSPSGAWLATTPISGGHDYGTVLPGINMRYAVTPAANVRIAFTRSLARPNYFDLVPYRSFNDSDNTIALGNSSLRPTLAWNVDAMFEHYLKSVGVLSAGVFYKKLHDYIYTFSSKEPVNGETFTVTQPLNGEDASLRG